MLCDNCLKFFDEPWTKVFEEESAGTFEGEFHSELAVPSCEFCTFLSTCPTLNHHLSTKKKSLSNVPCYNISCHSQGVEHRCSVRASNTRESDTYKVLLLSRESNILKHDVFYQPVSTTSTKPECCLPRLQAWIGKCAEYHALCTQFRRAGDTSWHPTRLVDVSLETCGPSIRLEDDPEKLLDADYTTLSYCWGRNAQFRKLQRHNYDDSKGGICISSLPKTLQHSVALTRALNIRYIWIDALCIIQDSVGSQDWLKEALKMSSVYGRSYLNIAASSSGTAEGGLFYERDPIVVSGVSVKPHGEERGGYVITDDRHWLEEFQFMPLNLRAWALQERRLSTRTVHFTDSQIFWECSMLCASEVFPQGKPWDVDWSPNQNQVARICHSKHATMEERDEAWWNLVWEYSKGELSVVTDRLVAIAGLAKSFDVLPGDEYIAGHWRLDMPHGLMWGCPFPVEQSGDIYRAPTWSWASIPGGNTITQPPQKLLPRAEILEIKLESRGDQFGPVDGGFMRLRGRVCKAKLTWYPLEDEDEYWEREYVLKVGTSGRRTASFSVCIDRIEDADDPLAYCLDLEMGRRSSMKSLKWSHIYPVHNGLLIRPTGRQKAEYRRVGCYDNGDTFSGDPDSNAKLLRFRARRWNDHAIIEAAFSRRDISSELYEELDEENQYTIRIV